jgi:hypothetical protein
MPDGIQYRALGPAFKKEGVVIRIVPVEKLRLLSNHEEHGSPEGKHKHPFFVIFVHFVVVRALPGFYA